MPAWRLSIGPACRTASGWTCQRWGSHLEGVCPHLFGVCLLDSEVFLGPIARAHPCHGPRTHPALHHTHCKKLTADFGVRPRLVSPRAIETRTPPQLSDPSAPTWIHSPSGSTRLPRLSASALVHCHFSFDSDFRFHHCPHFQRLCLSLPSPCLQFPSANLWLCLGPPVLWSNPGSLSPLLHLGLSHLQLHLSQTASWLHHGSFLHRFHHCPLS